MAGRREFDLVVVGLGGLGSAAAYWASRRLGGGVLGLERFRLGHERGASQDHSRINRLSYHSPGYVRFSQASYRAWGELEAELGEPLLVRTGGVDVYPAGAAIAMSDYTSSLDACGVPYEILDAAETMRRWPQWRLDDDSVVMFQADSGIAPAARCNTAHRELAVRHGATLIDDSPVTAIRESGGELEVDVGDQTYRCGAVVITADAWTNDVLASFDVRLNLTVTQEQVAYFASRELDAFAPDRFPLWIWMDEPCYYGFPAFGEAGAKIGQDVGGREVTGDTRSFEPDPEYMARLEGFMKRRLPGGFGPLIVAKTCLYTMPPDRDFIIDRVPGQTNAVVGQGAAHAFKFASVFGRSLVELALDGQAEADISAFTIDRPALTMADPPKAFLI